MHFLVELLQESDGRWIADIKGLIGVMVYGSTRNDALSKVQALALRLVADRLDRGGAGPTFVSVTFAAA